MLTVPIERSSWQNANHKCGATKLLNEYGMKCCLGFGCKVAGANDDELLFKPAPNSLKRLLPPFNASTTSNEFFNTHLSQRAIDINDDHSFTNAEREAKLIELGKLYDVEFVFSGEYNQEWLRGKK